MSNQFELCLNDADIIFSNHGDKSKISIYGYGVNKPTEIVMNHKELNDLILNLQSLQVSALWQAMTKS